MATRRPHPSNGEPSNNNQSDDVSDQSPPASKKFKKGKSQPVVKMLQEWATDFGCSINDLVFARSMDSRDTLKDVRNDFMLPKMQELPNVDLSLVNSPTEECIYMCGNSLGLQPKGVKKYIDNELKKWAQMGVHGHLNGDLPWALCDERVTTDMAKLVGAKESEVACMNGLTVNLHLMMVSFYRPTKERYKILIEKHAFPADHYAVESQIRLQGYDPKTSIIQAKPRPGEHTLVTEDILNLLEQEGSSIALVLFSGVQYYTGQFFDIRRITKAGHSKGCMVGWDLAHAIGNVPIKLNRWDVDFAVWCTYKYVNSGAGALAGAFLHEKHDRNDFPKLLGWWGHRMETRFDMNNEMELSPGISGYRISNPSIMAVCPIRASLDIFNQTSVERLRMKSKALTGYLEHLINTNFSKCVDVETSPSGRATVEIITPSDPEERGAQLSLLFSSNIENIHKELMKRGVCCDERKPNVLRIAPAPLYNNFEDVWRFNQALHDAVNAAYEMEKVNDGSEID
ncbi:kynureninase-like [Amphiura filiformis]|uniref:kynureninase-like n=1 Tax=Amphiura filiformis TaxID=82378 RepID=UPI003B21275F